MKFFDQNCMQYYSRYVCYVNNMSLVSCLEKAMAPHSSTFAWKIPWTEEPGGLHAVHGVSRSLTRLSDVTFTFHFHALEKEMATHFSVLACRIPGTGESGALPSLGSHRVRHDWSDLAAAAASETNWASLMAQTVMSLPAMQEIWVQPLGQKDPLEKRMATHSSTCLENFMDREGTVRLHGV